MPLDRYYVVARRNSDESFRFVYPGSRGCSGGFPKGIVSHSSDKYAMNEDIALDVLREITSMGYEAELVARRGFQGHIDLASKKLDALVAELQREKEGLSSK